MTTRNRLLVLVATVIALAAVATASVWHAAARADRRNEARTRAARWSRRAG